jgi:hypothetical protein
MSASAFQAAMVRLVIDRPFRERVARIGQRALPPALSRRERARVLSAAAHPGLDITRMMYVSFRLTRLQAGVPYTFRMLGKRGLHAEVSLYLERTRPTSFYFIDEGRGLLAHLRARLRSGALAMPYLADVVEYEAGLLALQEARNRGVNATVPIRLGHDIGTIIQALDAGKRPRRVRGQTSFIIGRVRSGAVVLSER